MRILAALILSSISVLSCFERSAFAGTDLSKETAFKEASYEISTDLPLCRYGARQPSNDVGDSAGSSLQRGSPDEVKKKLVADGSSSLQSLSPPDELKKRTEAALETYQKSIADYRRTTQADPLCSRIFAPNLNDDVILYLNKYMLPGCDIILGDKANPPQKLIFDCHPTTIVETKNDGMLFRYNRKETKELYCHRYKLTISPAGYLTSIEHFRGVIEDGICNPNENGPLLEKIYFQRVGDTCLPERASVFVNNREYETANMKTCRTSYNLQTVTAEKNVTISECINPPPELRSDPAFIDLCIAAADDYHKILSRAQAKASENHLGSCYACPITDLLDPKKTDAEKNEILARNRNLPEINTVPNKVKEILTIGNDFSAYCTSYYGWTHALADMYEEYVLIPAYEKNKANNAGKTQGQ